MRDDPAPPPGHHLMGDDLTALLIALCLFLLGAALASIEASLLATPGADARAARRAR